MKYCVQISSTLSDDMNKARVAGRKRPDGIFVRNAGAARECGSYLLGHARGHLALATSLTFERGDGIDGALIHPPGAVIDQPLRRLDIGCHVGELVGNGAGVR